MRKQIVEYTSPIDALVALVRQLNTYETQYQMDSAEFFTKYSKGETGDDEIFVEWAGNYQHYLALHQELAIKLQNVA
ncbi:MAG: hypothetical protein HLUCCA11_20495 [Phormidesmis priestleyi Ana]|uniref:Uncharacterized protein n=1 Tax=Phormidesmis priestleyi Ana TaxID=1666911 RepID=A0A0P7YQN1_9CYAN|nr:MAG: hypothetical protein HLUCCA11_20495 [Phormidesmis priestleyi Ana]